MVGRPFNYLTYIDYNLWLNVNENIVAPLSYALLLAHMSSHNYTQGTIWSTLTHYCPDTALFSVTATTARATQPNSVATQLSASLSLMKHPALAVLLACISTVCLSVSLPLWCARV